MKYKIIKTYLCISFALILIATMLIISIIFIKLIDNELTFKKVIALLFWLCVIFEQIFFWLSNNKRKKLENQLINEDKLIVNYLQPGLVSFFRNKEATVADIAFISSSVLLTVLSVNSSKIGWLILSTVAMVFLTFNLHCLLNGKNYFFVKRYSK